MIALLLAACTTAPLPEVREGPGVVEVRDVSSFEVDALLPTDLLPLPGDELLVLDGYRQRAVVVDGSGSVVRTLGDSAWGRAVRITPRDGGGFWLADPGDEETQPAIVATRADGTSEHALVVHDGDTDVRVVSLADGGGLVVGDRGGHLRWVDETGTVTDTLSADVDGLPFGAIVDVSRAGDGWLIVDALGHRVHRIGPDHQPTAAWGRFGEWPGTFQRATSAAPTPLGNVLATDSSLGVVQLFAADGPVLGLVATDAATENHGALRFDHPLAVRADDDDPRRFYVLDGSKVVTFHLAESDEVTAQDNRTIRFLRVDLNRDPVKPGPKLCFQCHDGLVVDSREHWDPDRKNHPVDVTPDDLVTIPEDLPLSDDGKIVCLTCHSPHGTPEGATFVRATVTDSALCTGCHGAQAHEQLVENLGLPGGAHPVGAELKKKLGDKNPAETGACLDCHAPHGGRGDPILRTDSGTLCSACHDDHATAGTNHPLGRRVGRDVPHPRQAAALVTARDGGVQCRTCHDLVGGRTDALLRTPMDGGVLCLVCHAEPDGFSESPHAILGTRGVPCLGCHDPHGVPESKHFLRSASYASVGDPSGCLMCHGPGGKGAKPGIRPGQLGHEISAGEGARKIDGCQTCHDAHSASVPTAAFCEKCHDDQAAAHARGGHGSATCLDCHPPHSSPRLARNADPLAARCLGCHGEGAAGSTKQVSTFQHPVPLFLPDGSRWKPLGTLPLFDEQGHQVAPGDNGNLSCPSCHETHGPGPDGRSKLRRDGWKEACSACHGTDALSYYQTWHRPDLRGHE